MRILLFLMVGAIVALMLTPTGGPGGVNLQPFGGWAWRFQCALSSGCETRLEVLQFIATDLLGNLLIFLPLGFLMGYVRREWALAILVGVGLSVFIEVAQYWVPGRASDIDDLILNSTGVALGFAAAKFWLSHKARVLAKSLRPK